MPLVLKRDWNASGTEPAVLKYLIKLYKKEKAEAFLYHNVLLGSLVSEKVWPIKPDFILLDPKRGIAIIEIKSWKEFTLDGNRAILANNKVDLNPIIKAQNYFFNLSEIFKQREISTHNLSITSHLIFTNIKYSRDNDEHYVEIHDKNFKKTLNLENLFSKSEAILSKNLEKIQFTLNPIVHFPKKSEEGDLDICKLNKTQENLVGKNIFGHYKVSGIPGSGKSIIVASRAILYKESFPEWRILILSVNSNLINKIVMDIDRRLKGREIPGPKIESITLKSFLYKYCPNEKRAELMQIRDYKEQMDFLHSIVEVKREWDAVLIDEYQDFEEEDFEIILKSCKRFETQINKEKRKVENLFLCGDELQQIWHNKIHSWGKVGINISGRTTILKKSYRSPSDVTLVALEYLNRAGLSKEVDKYYEGIEDIELLKFGENSCNLDIGWDMEGTLISLAVQSLLSGGVPHRDILIIAPPGRSLKLIEKVFEEESKKGMVLGSYYNVKGLEAPFVFIYNLGGLDYILKDSMKRKARIIYMCLTRATQTVHISSFKDEDSAEILKLVIDYINENKNVA